VEGFIASVMIREKQPHESEREKENIGEKKTEILT
jgi:hypothetical protein